MLNDRSFPTSPRTTETKGEQVVVVGGGVPPPKLRKRRTPQMAKYKATNGDPTTKNEDEKRQHKSCSFEFLKQINQQQINLININQSRA
jgi:hypothetical protein